MCRRLASTLQQRVTTTDFEQAIDLHMLAGSLMQPDYNNERLAPANDDDEDEAIGGGVL